MQVILLGGSLGPFDRRRLIAIIGLCLVVFAGMFFNGIAIIRAVDDRLLEQRMAVAPRKATGQFAFVAIDKQGLDQIGVWPWPRSIYGRIIRELTQAGVKDIGLDIDFSVPSIPAEDTAFADALRQAGGGVILVSFFQHKSADAQRNETAVAAPIPFFADHARIGAVSVVPDRDGILRTMPYRIVTPEGALQSLSSIFAGREYDRSDQFLVDFSIDPTTIPTYSVTDLLAGRVPPGSLSGKSVLVGAYAVELKDYFNVPVNGAMAGPVVQLIAAETLAQGRAVEPANFRSVLGLTAAALLLFFIFRPKKLFTQVLMLAAIALVFEVAGLLLFRSHALWLQTAGAHLSLSAVALGRAIIELDLRRMLLRKAAIETRNTKQILQQVITDNSDAILIADDKGRILEMSVRVHSVFRPPLGIGQGSDLMDLLPERLMREVHASLDDVKSGATPATPVSEVLLPGEEGERCIEYSITPSRLETSEGSTYVVCIAARDITLRRRQEARLDRMSRYDELTGALRQGEFVERLDRQLTLDARPWAVYSLNLHRFKTINTTLGRDIGDELMTTLVRTLADCDPAIRLVGRTGGDSFCLACEGHGPAEIAGFADKLIRLLSNPFIIGENRAMIGVHIGISMSSGDDRLDAATLLENAEFALDQAREINGSGWTVFDTAASSKIVASRQVERELWRALERGEIFVTYQPQVDLVSRELLGVEALVRWQNPALGMISPADFVQIAEANGFVEKLGEWVLLTACMDASGWQKPISVAVNVSPLQFSRGDVVGAVKRALKQSGLTPSRLHLEITESIFLYQSADVAEKLKSLRALGISLALDDFGTGYSSFGYIAHFPPDKIKVDQLFVRTIEESAANRAILRSVRSLCEGLGVEMICEGVENEAQLAFLLEIGCRQGQGWLFGKPQLNDVIGEMTRLTPQQGTA